MKLPSKEVALIIPVELILAKVEAVLVMMLSVDATSGPTHIAIP